MVARLQIAGCRGLFPERLSSRKIARFIGRNAAVEEICRTSHRRQGTRERRAPSPNGI